MREIVARLVKEDVAEAAAENHTQCRPEEKVVERLTLYENRRSPGERQAVMPANDEARDIGQRVPADRKRPKLDKNWIDCGVRDAKHAFSILAGAAIGNLTW